MKIKSVTPKDFWEFFAKKMEPKLGVFLHPELTGLCAATTEDLAPPPGAPSDTVSKSGLVVVLKILVALKGGRPVKLIPSGPHDWSVYYGPKPS